MSEDEKSQPRIDPEIEEKLPAPYAQAIKDGRVPADILKHSHDADEALKALQGHDGQVLELDDATNKRILRAIDWNLIPV